MALSSHKRFFANHIDVSVEIDLLKEFILHMDASLKEADVPVSDALGKEQMIPPLEVIPDDRDYLLTSHFPKLLHSGFIISVLSFFEQQLIRFCNNLKTTENHGLRVQDLAGSFLERFRNYCIHVAQLPIPTDDWEDIKGAMEVRNCLVHNAGMLDGFNKEKAVRAFVRRHHTPSIARNNVLVVTRETSLCVLNIIHSFVESIHKAALIKYPKHEKGSN